MKKIIFLIASIVLIASCTTFRKVQVLKEALSKKDTTEVQLISEKSKVDSTAIVKSIVDKLALTKIDFKTMNARLKVDYTSANNADNYIVNLSLLKDAAIYITIRGAMGVIGLKALVNKDSLILIYPLRKNKNIERRSLGYLQEVLKVPFSFTALQDLLIGNPIFMDNAKLVSYKVNNNNLEIGLIGNLFKNLIVLNEDYSKILQLKLDDIDISQHRTFSIAYSNHVTVNQYQFPLNRDLIISAPASLEVHMEVKEFNFNEPLKYTFELNQPSKRK